MGVDGDEVWGLAQAQRENKGWMETQIQELQRLCDSPKYRVESSDEEAAQVNERLRAEFRVIKEQWSLLLEQYGYPL